MEKTPKSSIKKSVLKLLRPIVRLLIKNEVSHSEFSEIAKEAYVDVAYSHFGIPGRKKTYSRIAVLTGLSRKEVVRLSKDEAQHASPKMTPNRAARVVLGWLKDKTFLDNNNQPLILPLRDEENSFAQLVERYSGDITARAIIDELTRLKIATVIDKKFIRLDKQGYIPESNDEASIDILSSCASDMLHTGVHNICKTEDEPAQLQRQFNHHNVPLEVVEEFEKYAEEQAAQLLLNCSRWLKEKTQSSVELEESEKTRASLGVYYYQDPNNNDTQP